MFKIILLFLFFNSVHLYDLINGDCDSTKCAQLCFNNHKYYNSQTLMHSIPLSKCEYYSYCSCFKNNYEKTRLN